MHRFALPGLIVAMLATGCTSGADQPVPPTPTSTTTNKTWPTPPDSGLRPVTIPYSDGIAYVWPETAAQAICQALSPEKWHELFDGDIGRTIKNHSATAECVVTSGALEVSLSTTSTGSLTDVDGTTETIAGRSARVKAWESTGGGAAAVELIPVAEKDPANRPAWFRPVLNIAATTKGRETRVDIDELLRELIAKLPAKLIHTGPLTPVEDNSGHMPYTPTQPVPGVPLYDLPAPVQGLVLCTVLANGLGSPPPRDAVVAEINGECRLEGFRRSASVVRFTAMPTPAQFTIAGHPARSEENKISIDLADFTTDPSGREHVLLRLIWVGVDDATRRMWAEQIVTALGDL